MSLYALSHLSDGTLTHALDSAIADDRASTADVLAHIAEFDARKLYLPAGYPSMFVYCVDKLHLCEQAAFKRIRAARAARRFPEIFSAVAEGRLHLTAVVLLVPYLTEDNAEELLSAATHRSKAEIEQLLAGTVDVYQNPESAPVAAPAPHASDGVVSRPKVQPLSPQSYAVQFTMSRSAHEKLRYAQELLSHQVPSGDLAQVFERALDALIPHLEKAKFVAATKPRRGQRRTTRNARHIPADVKRAVWKRDGGRCTFMSASGHRCPARARLETLWNDGLAIVRSCRLREERPTVVARSHR